METYFFLDSILTKEEKESITEIYWACRFGYVLKELMENNPSYPNLTAQYTIDDEKGKAAMRSLDPVAVPFWHFRPDFHPNFEVGLDLFGLKDDWDNAESSRLLMLLVCFKTLKDHTKSLLSSNMQTRLMKNIFCSTIQHQPDLGVILLLS